MILLNKFLKAVTYFVVRLLSALLLEILALLVTSPVFLFVLGIMDLLNKIPSLIQGRYLLSWLIVSAPFFIGFNIYTDIAVSKPKRRLKDNKQNSDNQKS